MAADTSYPNIFQVRQDGNAAVPTGKSLDIESGGAFKLAGNDVTAAITAHAISTGTANGTVAAAGSSVADAAAVASDFSLVTAGDGTKGVILPVMVGGQTITVKNNSGSILKVYPSTGAAINALSANGAISMAANTIAQFKASSATQVWTLPLLPS